MRLGFLFIFAATLATSANAQDACIGLLKYTGNDYADSSVNNLVASDIYSQYCSGSQASTTSGTQIDLKAIVQSIPVNFNFGGSSAREVLNNFCKTYSSNYIKFSSETKSQSTVVRKALSAFNECIALTSNNILIRPKLVGNQVVVDIKRGSDDAAFQGAQYESNLLTCKMPVNADIKESVIANENTYLKLSGDYVTISCIRKPIEDSSGIKRYPEATLTILTSRGSLSIPIPSDSVLPLSSARELAQRIEDIENSIPKLKKLQLYKCPRDLEHKPGMWATWGCTGQISSQSQCFNYTHVGSGDSSSWYVYKSCEPITVFVPE